MLRFSEKKTFKRYLYSRGVLVLLAILILFTTHAVYGVYKKAQSAALYLAESEKSLAEMEEREKYFSKEIERLKSDQGVEEEIRKKFQVAREGEKVMVIMDDEGKGNGSTELPKKSLWQKILNIF